MAIKLIYLTLYTPVPFSRHRSKECFPPPRAAPALGGP